MPALIGTRRAVHFARSGAPAPVVPDAAETTAFLARTTGLDAPHIADYKTLINGLVADGDFAKFTGLYVTATQTSVAALLSLPSATYNATATGAPTFTADTGYVGGADGKYLDTNFNPFLAADPLYLEESNLLFVWSTTAGQDDGFMIGAKGDAANKTVIGARSTSNQARYRSNTNGLPGVAVASGAGLYSMERTGHATTDLYKDGVLIDSDNVSTNSGFASANLTILDINGSTNFHSGNIACAGFGSPLGAAGQLRVYNRLRAYMTAKGIP